MTDKWSKFKSTRIVDGKLRKAVVDICGDIINRNPTEEDLKGLKKESDVRITRNNKRKLSEEEHKEYLLEFLKYFYDKHGRVPGQLDFNDNSKYPSFENYRKVFGSWNNAIELAGFMPIWGPGHLYTDEDLLEFLIRFYEENGGPPTERNFTNNSDYPGFSVYQKRFGGWQKALKLVGLDTDSMVKKGIVKTTSQKARLGELFVKDHFKEIGAIDLSGENCNSPYDGKCPRGYNYDAKTSALHIDYWTFGIDNLDRIEIEWYYLLAFNEYYTELLHAWRIPAWDLARDIEKGYIQVWSCQIERMAQYEITEKVFPMFKDWLNNIQK